MDVPFADELLHTWVRCRLPVEGAPTLDSLHLSHVRRVLLVLTTGLGDAVLSTPVFPALRRALPQADIRLFCRIAWLGLFDRDPSLTGVIPYRGKYRAFFTMLRALRAFDPDVALVLHGNDPDIIPLTFLAGSRHIVRIPTTGTRYHFLLANRNRVADREAPAETHYIENRLRVLDTLGVPHAVAAPEIHLDTALIRAVSAQMQSVTHGHPYWVLHVYAADAYKVWPLTHVRALLDAALARYPRHRVVLTGTAQDQQKLAPIVARFASERVASVAGRFSVAQTAACLAGARAVVGPDTGILHVAAGLDVPTVGLYAPTRADLVGARARTAPVRTIQKPRTCDGCTAKRCAHLGTAKHCMEQINVNEVLAELDSLLGSA